MSMRALLLAVRDQLRDTKQLGLDNTNCEVTADEQPFPVAGEIFVAVWYGYWRNKDPNGMSLDEDYGVNVTVSVRATRVATDRIGPSLLAKANDGLLALCEQIRAAIHMDPEDSNTQAVVWRANKIIGATVNGFIAPLQFRDGGRPTKRSGSWFGARGGKGVAGLSQTLTFTDANRVQTIEGSQ